MTRGDDCHIPEWAELLDSRVPDGVCDRETSGSRDPFEFEREGS
jgi:hypothetical protein